MPTYEGHLELQIVDVNGDTAGVRLPVAFADTKTLAAIATEVGAFATAVVNCSNGKIIRQSFGVLFNEAHLVVGSAPPTDAEYSSVTDGARLQFASGNGDRTSITVPAPLETDFGASSNVVDSTDANVAALITFVAANAGDLSGTNFNLYKGGIKVGKRARRRRSSLVP